MQVAIEKSSRAGKKWMAAIENGPTVHFGATGYQDYTQHADDKRKAAYWARHRKNEDWTLQGVRSAGFWSRWLLWNKPAISASIADVNRRFSSLSVSLR